MGALMRKSTKKELVNKLLDAMFANIRHVCPVEREVFTRPFTVDLHFVLLHTLT